MLITGASTGIGRACAIHLAGMGYSVLAGVRAQDSARSLEAEAPAEQTGCIRALPLDVTDTASISRVADELRSIVGPDGLHGLINNAGICVAGPVEFLPPHDLRTQFDVNVFGQIAVTQAMLPLLRAHVRAYGLGRARIVMISSIAGRVSQPIVAAYCASKHALEAFSDGLRIELRPQGVRVVIIEPGAIRTEIWRKALEQTAMVPPDAPAREFYGKQLTRLEAAIRRIIPIAIPPDSVARVVAHCLEKKRPPARVLVGTDAKLVAALKAILPTKWFDKGQMWVMRRSIR